MHHKIGRRTATMRIPRKRSAEEERSSILSPRNIVLAVLTFGGALLVVSSRSNEVVRLMTEVHSTAASSSAAQVPTSNALVTQHSGSSEFQLANVESFGFFTDIPEREWTLLKERVKEIQPNFCDWCRGGNSANAWFQNHYEPEFACRFEKRVGRQGDGGKWICDPHRYLDNKDCLVYSVGSNNDFSFEREVKKVIGKHCEIHTFDPDDYSERAKEEGAIYHQWGISNESGKDSRGKVMKTLRQTAEELGHIGRTIDIFKIDCEGCELESYETWVDSSTIGVHLQQVLVEIHAKGKPNARMNQEIVQPGTGNFFKGMHKHGYVIFHKEPNIHYWSMGNCVEFAFLKLAPSFFEGME